MKLKTCLALLSGLILGVAFAEDGYIQSDGTQFVNTGYHVKETTRLEIDYQLISFVGQDRIFCGDGFDNTIAVEFYVQGTATNSGTLAFIYGNPYQTASKVATATLDRTKASIDFEKGVCTIGTSKATLNKSYITGQASGGVPVALFGKNTKAAGDVADYRATMKLYGFKVYESDVLVHDYVPAKKDGEVGLYDKVEIFMENLGKSRTIQLVTTLRQDALKGLISKESPVGKAVMGHKAGETVHVDMGNGKGYDVKILSIEKGNDDGTIPIGSF